MIIDPKQIILFPPTETAFNNNGIGHLSDAISCLITEERNGAFELEMQYPISGNHYADIVQRSVIMAKSRPNDDGQYFRVYRITKPINGIVTVYAAHISYDLAGTIVEPFTAGSVAAAMTYLENASVGDNGFTFSTDKSTVATMAVKVPSSVRSLLGGSENSVLDIYGGEWEFDRFNCYLHNNRGQDRGFTIRYGKNLTDLTQEENCASVYTAVYPYWSSSEGDTVVTLPEKTIDVADVISGAHYDYNKVLVADFSGDYQEQPTVAELRSHTQAYIRNNNIGIPSVSLSVSFVQLEQTAEYQDMAIAQQIYLCDTVSVEFEKLGVSAKAKVIKTVYNALLDRYEKIEIGDAKMSIADTIVNQQQEIKKLDPANIMSDVEAAAVRASQLITGNRGGYVVIHSSTGSTTPDEILIMDTPNIQTAQKVWRWNNSGLGYSDTGYSGTYTTAWTIDGAFNADFITAGFLSANRIKAGVITSEGQDISTFIYFSGIVNIDENTYKEVTSAVVNIFKYTNGGWNIRNGSTFTPVSLADYGITVDGSVNDGDYFAVVNWQEKIINSIFDLDGGKLVFDYGDVAGHMAQLIVDKQGIRFEWNNQILGKIEGMIITERGVASPYTTIKFDDGIFSTLECDALDVYGDIEGERIDLRSDGNVFASIRPSQGGGTLELANSSGTKTAVLNANGGLTISGSGNGITLDGEKITSWDDITPSGGGVEIGSPSSSSLAFIVCGQPTSGGYYSSVFIPNNSYIRSNTWQLADETNYVKFKISSSGGISSIGGSSGHGNIDEVYGLNVV